MLRIDRAVEGAMQDIHPPGWPLIAWASLRLPLDLELALRLPAVLSYAVLVAVLALRHPLAGLALLVHLPLVDMASQGRGYSTLALGLVGIAMLAPRGWHLLTGLLVGVIASLHGAAGLLAGTVLLASLPWKSLRWSDGLTLTLAAALPQLWWVFGFLERASGYVKDPWYTPSAAWDWMVITDGRVGLAMVLVAVAASLPTGLRRLLPAVCVLAVLCLAEALGQPMEVRKLGVVLPGLILLGLTEGSRPNVALALAALGFLASNRPVDARPDLREAAAVVQALPAMPILTLHPSELRRDLPTAMWSGRTASETNLRLARLFNAHDLHCAALINLWNTAPLDHDLDPPLRLVAWTPVTGLDVRVVGDEDCVLDPLPEGWRLGSPCEDPELARWLCEGRP